MSVESAKAFLEKFENEEAFRKELKGAGSQEEVAGVIKAAGFEFTQEEWKEASQKDEILSEDQLKSASGGVENAPVNQNDSEMQAQIGLLFGGQRPPISPINLLPPSPPDP
ncbi:MAG: Nif11-like leader peptide family natural product precursor [Planctomycetota bacterium]|nr:Nif11-like leader peptide family natural product precursor [Planctomycetota bacterium]